MFARSTNTPLPAPRGSWVHFDFIFPNARSLSCHAEVDMLSLSCSHPRRNAQPSDRSYCRRSQAPQAGKRLVRTREDVVEDQARRMCCVPSSPGSIILWLSLGPLGCACLLCSPVGRLGLKGKVNLHPLARTQGCPTDSWQVTTLKQRCQRALVIRAEPWASVRGSVRAMLPTGKASTLSLRTVDGV